MISTTDLAEILKDCGTLTIRPHVDLLSSMPLASNLLARQAVQFTSGPLNFHQLCEDYYVDLDSSPSSSVSQIWLGRARAVKKLLERFEQLFCYQAGENAKPEEWRTVLLRGEWMKEYVYHQPGQPSVCCVQIGCAFLFEKIQPTKAEATHHVLQFDASDDLLKAHETRARRSGLFDLQSHTFLDQGE